MSVPFVLIAADAAARSPEVADKLFSAPNDATVIAIVGEEVSCRYEALARLAARTLPTPASTPPGGSETLGIRDVFAAGKKRIADIIDGARGLTRRASQGAMRGASLVALKAKRNALTLSASIFLGDIFEYFRRGQGNPKGLGTISGRVAEKMREASLVALAREEPFVLVGHSFGGIIAYDLLTSPFTAAAPEFEDVKVDLWVTVGSQVGLFAEMRAYVGSPDDVPSHQSPTLGKPRSVGRWLNFYDAADVFSYLAEPVFGSDAVNDVEVRGGAQLTNAHGAYFSEPTFYRRVAEGLK